MAPTYNLGDCPECCPVCEYEIEITIEEYDADISNFGYLTLSRNGGPFLQGGGVPNITGPGGQFSAYFIIGANAAYDGTELTITFPDGPQGQIYRTVVFTNVNVVETALSGGTRWVITSNTCQEI